MGASCSKRDSVDVASPPAANVLNPGSGLSSYLSACQSDPQLRDFDSALREQTTRVLNTLSESDGHQVGGLSLESLRAVTGCFSEVNQEVVRYVLSSKKDVWKSQELLDLVQQYFDYTDNVLAFFNALNACLKAAQHRQLIIDLALRHFEEESKSKATAAGNSVRFARTLQELRNFKDQGSPFSDEFVKLFKSVQDQQMQMLYKLKDKQQKLSRKMKSVKIYKKVSLVIFAACFVGVIVFSVVAAAIAAPPLVTALAAAMSAPMGGMGKWLNSLWNKYQNELKAQSEVIHKVEMTTFLTVMELDSIRVLVTRLEIEIEALLTSADFSLRDDSTLVVVIADVKNKLGGLTLAITQLEDNATIYSRDIRQGRTVILQGISRRGSETI